MPRFTAAVIVHGQAFATPAHCKSAKEAQNTAAQIAFDHLSVTPPPPSTPAPAAAVNSAAPPDDSQPKIQPVSAASSLSPPPSSLPIPPPPDGLHLYKNQLQQYAQKENLGFPVYTSEAEGPPHARRFSARVSIDGKSYETLEFFRTLKEAEQAAAKVACQVLSMDVIQEDGGLYKNLLQEFAQKKGLRCPSYETVKSGLSHNPIFVTTVEIGTDTFRGAEAKTKKQAEMNAAKVAYCALLEGSPATKSSEVSSINECPVADKSSEVSFINECPVADNLSQNIQPTATIEMHQEVSSIIECPVANNLSQNIQSTTTIEMHQEVSSIIECPVADNLSQNFQPTATIEMHQEVSSIIDCPVADNLSQNIQPTATIEMHQDVTDEDHPHAKRAKSSPENTNVNSHLQDASHSDPPCDDSNLLYSQVENSASAEAVTEQTVEMLDASVEDSGFPAKTSLLMPESASVTLSDAI